MVDPAQENASQIRDIECANTVAVAPERAVAHKKLLVFVAVVVLPVSQQPAFRDRIMLSPVGEDCTDRHGAVAPFNPGDVLLKGLKILVDLLGGYYLSGLESVRNLHNARDYHRGKNDDEE
jgi:hypothetical protein